MVSCLLRCTCPHCAQPVLQAVSNSGPSVCPHCYKFFYQPSLRSVPPWVLAVLAVLAANLLVFV